MSWNSSTMTMRKRSCVASRTASSSRSRSRAASWRSSKSTTDSRRFDAAYSAPNRSSSSCRSVAIIARRAPRARPARRALRACSNEAARAPRAGECGQVDEPLGRGPGVERAQRLGRVPPLRRRGGHVRSEALGLDAELLDRGHDARALAELEDELATGGAQRLEDAGEHAPQPVGPVRREQPQPLGISRRRRTPRARGRTPRRGAPPHPPPRARGNADRGLRRTDTREEPTAEAVDRRDPRTVELAREVGAPALAKRRADAAAQLARRLARVRDDEDRLDVDPAVAHGPHVALDENRRLPGSRTGGDEDGARRLDGLELLLVQRALDLEDRHARFTLHIGQRSHHAGHPSPFGSWRTSPTRIRPAFSAARSRADSTWLQNESSSR